MKAEAIAAARLGSEIALPDWSGFDFSSRGPSVAADLAPCRTILGARRSMNYRATRIEQ